MIVWRDRETGPVHPSIRSAPSTGTFGMSLSVTTFMTVLLLWRVFRVALKPIRSGSFPSMGRGRVGDRLIPEQQRLSFLHPHKGSDYGLRRHDCGDHLDQRRQA